MANEHLKVIKLKKHKKSLNPDIAQLSSTMNGKPVSSSIMNGNLYKLKKEREDLYERVAKTVNIDYDPRSVQPFLKKLAKAESVHNLKPLGLAHESHFPAELRAQFHFMKPISQDDPTMFAIMGGRLKEDGTNDGTDFAFCNAHLH